MEQVLKIDKVEKYYGNKTSLTKALDTISFDVEKKEFVAIMGASGSGKTTLAKMLSGYYTKSSGHVILDKASIRQAELRQLVTYVPQQTMCLREQY